MKQIYLESAWKHNLSVNDLVLYPPEGYRFSLDSSLEESFFKRASRFEWTYAFQAWLGSKVPLKLVKSYLEKTRRVPGGTQLTYASIHLDFRDEPWILDMQVEPPHLLLWNRWAPKQSGQYRERVKKVLLSPHCKKVICWIEGAKKALLAWLGDELADKVETVYWGIPRRDFAKKYGGTVKLLFVNSANINREAHFNVKGGSEVLAAFLELDKHYPNLELVIRSGLPESIKYRYGQKSNIKIIDKPVAWAELEKEWQSADIFVFPTRVTPAKVFLDAMSYELPIVTTDVWGNPEMVTDGKTGLLVRYPAADDYIHDWVPYYHAGFEETFKTTDPALVQALIQKISLLIENPQLRRGMGKAGRQEAEEGRFSLENRNEKLKRIFDEATAD